MRVVSLIASATELIAALGCEEWLVGRSHECDYPPAVNRLPVCSSAKIDIQGSSREIDDRVRNALLDATSIYNVDSELLASLAPDVVVTQTQCEVCAVSLKDVEAAVCGLLGDGPRVVACEPNSLADIWADFRRVAEALGVSAAGDRLIASSQSRLERMARAVAGQPRPTVGCIEWIDPLMAAGNWVPELLEIAGGTNLFGEAGRHSPYFAWEDLVRCDPEYLFVMPCGWDIPKAAAELRVLEERPEWSSLRAVRDRNVILTDGNQYFNRPGPRVVESAEIFAEVLHADRCRFGHEGTGWIRLHDAVR